MGGRKNKFVSFPAWAAGILLLCVLAVGCGPGPTRNYLRLPYQGRPEYAPPRVPLHQKAQRFQELLERDHISPIGLIIYVKYLREDGQVDDSYSDLNDTPIWGGIHLAQESFRYAVTGKGEALAAVRRSVRSLHLLQAATGVPGLLARHLAPDGDPRVNFQGVGNPWRRAAGNLPGLWWKGNVSKDQYAGMIFGYGVAYDLVPEEDVREQIRKDMSAIADFIIRNKYRILGFDGRPTKHSDLRARIAFVPIGVDALISLAAVKVAAHVTGAERFKREYRRLVRRRWPQTTRLAKIQFFGKTNHNNDNMAILSCYNLLRLEEDPKVKRYYRRSMDRTWKYVGREGNAFWNFMVLGTGGKSPFAREEAILQLRNFPLTRLNYKVNLLDRKDIEHSRYRNRKGVPKARYALPLNLRSRSSFEWKNCPYALYSGSGQDATKQFIPVDYLVTYWMGRYHALLSDRE